MRVAAVIVAGGSGLRAGGEAPKQYQFIGGRPVLWWTLKAFSEHPGISMVQTVIGDGHQAMFEEARDGLGVLAPVAGGPTRQASCRAGIEALERHRPDRVLIHDAARPFASRDLISHVIAWLDRFPAVVPGLPVGDTLKLAPGGIVKSTIDRTAMWAAQTPQGFQYPHILAAHRDAVAAGEDNLTDDAAVAERAGIEVTMIPGRAENKKLTTADDISEADAMMRRREADSLPDIRVGQGIDIHAFEPGNRVVLCGIAIPFNRKLKGHSDADVAMHALTDAIFGAVGESDIGQHFPPSEARWKDANSEIFLAKALSCIQGRGGRLANVDLTILAEAPRIGPHLAAMKSNLARLLGIDVSRVAIKATTAERLGAIGRAEGIMALATATVRLP